MKNLTWEEADGLSFLIQAKGFFSRNGLGFAELHLQSLIRRYEAKWPRLESSLCLLLVL
jgi:hypothetical protein